jgi:putative protease
VPASGPVALLSPPPPLPELLSPAGDWECARAAVENGADAIYFGLDRFNARMRAHNFTEADLPRLMEFLHRRGVRGYVTFNTLVFTEELPAAAEYLRAIIAAGVDAAIVQDIGICRLIRRLSPDFPIHGSTQMTVTSPAGVQQARALGCELVVLARENSLKDIAAIQAVQQSRAAVSGEPPLPLEVFVHGALCVAYSGQCLTSESLGGRSANRGECAQACRMPYELVSDGQTVPLGDRRYLLSPQDLSGLEVLPDLIRAGVSSLKIEGRLKSPGYVAGITRVYREALDKLGVELGRERDPGRLPAVAQLAGFDLDRARYELEMGFSRGLYTGWFKGINNQELAHARFGKKRGVYLGSVERVERDRIVLRLAGPVKPGDGVVFDAGRPDLPEQGGRVYGVAPLAGDLAALEFGHTAVDLRAVQVGDRLWKTGDPALERELEKTYAGETTRWQRPVVMEVHGHVGSPLTLIVRDERGLVVQLDSQVPLAAAERQPLSTERLQDQLGRLGGSPFRLGELRNHLEGAVILPVSELNRLRREAVTALEARRVAAVRWTFHEAGAASPWMVAGAGVEADSEASPAGAPELIVLVRRPEQLEAALKCGVTTLYCEFEDPKRYREAVRTVHESCACAGPQRTVWVAPPRVFKPGEEWILKQVTSAGADGYLVRNAEHLAWFAGSRRRGDFSLNVANPLTAEHFIRGAGLESVTAGYDLNAGQLESLLRAAPPEWFEITIHQHMPMFHMEHCVFCAFMSAGTDYTNCGRPCEKHEVRLRDRVGMEHPLKADAGCRNTVFNARAQTGAESVARLLALGARRFRLEFVSETPEEVERTVARYRALLRGELTGEQLWRELKLQNQLGVTRGQMEQGEARKVFPKAG